jgi:NHL repeat-containing protein
MAGDGYQLAIRGTRWPAVACVLGLLAGTAVVGARPALAQAHQAGGWTASAVPAPGIITTVAGGVGGPAVATSVDTGACGVLFAHGFLYVAAGGSVRKIDPRTDWLTTPAGTGALGPAGTGGPATRASLGTCGLSADLAGNLVITNEHTISVVPAEAGTFYGQAMAAGHIYTVAGNGTPGLAGDGGPATKAELDSPGGVAVDGVGDLVIADTLNSRVRVVAASTGTRYGQAMAAGHIYTVAGTTHGFAGDGGPAAQAELMAPNGVAVDGGGNLLISDTGNSRVRVVAGSTGSFYGQAMTAGDIYTVAGNGTPEFSGDGGPAAEASLWHQRGVAVDGAGNVLIADWFHSRVRVVAGSSGSFYGQAMTTGDIYTIAGSAKAGFAGDGGPATAAQLRAPSGVAVDDAGDVLIADSENAVVRLVAASTGARYGQMMSAGDIYTVAGGAAVPGDQDLATRAQLAGPDGVAADAGGDLLIADGGDERVRVVAASTGTFFGQAMTAGHIYSIAGDGTAGYNGDGGPASSAELWMPGALALDGAGNLVIPDENSYRVRVVAAVSGTFYRQKMTAGHIYTVAGDGKEGYSGDHGPATKAMFNAPSAVAVDGTGNLLIADWGNDRVRAVAARTGTFYGQKMTAGDIYTVAGDNLGGYNGDGGPATEAELLGPAGVALDRAGNLLIADSSNERVRAVAARAGTFYGQKMTTGHIYTVAGNGKVGYSGDHGPAAQAALYAPSGIAVDRAGNLVIADRGNKRVRVVAGRTGTFYGQKMTTGRICTVAGTGALGFAGDGGQGTHARLNFPVSVAVNPAGELLIADQDNARVRMVSG